MPASTLDPAVSAALRTALSKNTTANNTLDSQLAGSTKKALLSNIEFEGAGSYQSSVLDKLKSKYIVLKSSKTQEPSKQKQNKPENTGADELLTPAKRELYPIQSVQLGWNNADWSVGAGMVNMGNTCYLNSTLQALFHVPALVNWLMSDKQHMSECEDSGGMCIICAMRKTLQDSQQRNISSIRPFLIYNKLKTVCRNLIPGRQEDAHEFLRYLVEAMEKAYLNRFKNQSEFDARTKETTPLNQILGGYLRSMVRCLACQHISTTFQHFQDFLLDIRKAQTLDEALDLYFSREKLDDDSYHCEACQRKVPATKQFSLEKAPMVLCIQLKRFSISNNKITKHIQFRSRLELTRHMRKRPPSPLVYRLVALVTHMGPTVNCGHYTAVAQSPSGHFHQFDDSMVRPISHQAVFGTNAYIMFYELECPPHLQTSSKIKLKTPSSTTSKPDSDEVTLPAHLNGTTKMYGPALPPIAKLRKPATNGRNGDTLLCLNGNGTQSSSESDPEQPIPLKPLKENNLCMTVALLSTPSKIPLAIQLSKAPLMPKPPNNVSSTFLSPKKLPPSTSNASNSTKVLPETSTSRTTPTKKLVPYDMDDSSSCSEESNNDSLQVSTKAKEDEWKVIPVPAANNLSTENNAWEKKKSNTVNELLRLSHGGYAAPVSTWNGTRSQLDKEVNNDRREERKRALVNEQDQGRVKHIKLNSNGPHRNHIPGYNSIQEYHNAKNWNQSNGSTQHYRPFYNSNRHRNNNRRNFHHKAYHKNYRFRQ